MKFIITLFILVVNTFVFSQLPSYVPKNGLVGYWHFDGNANDYSGNNNNGVVKGATLITGRTGIASTAYNFNGNDNTIEISHNTILNLDTAFSINLWAKLPASQVNNPASYVSKYSLSQKSGFVFPYINEGSSGFGLNLTTENGNTENAAGQGEYLTSQISNKTSWHQFTAVFSNGNYKLYVDGFMVKANSGLGNTLVNNTNNLIFGNSTGYNQFAKGGLDEVGIWNRSLTENEIIALNGCVAPIASITANTSTNICPGSSVALSANSGSNFTYQWYRNDTIIQGATSISYTASNIGSYAVIVKSGPCPTTSTTINVTYSLPDNKVYNPFADTIHSCINDVVLDAGAGFTSYLWDDKSTNQTLTVKESGAHKVKIIYGNNCTVNDSTYVNLIEQAKIRAIDTTICYKDQLVLTNEPAFKNVRYLKYNVYGASSNYVAILEVQMNHKGINVAKNKKAYTNAGETPEAAIDGLLNTGWASMLFYPYPSLPSQSTPHNLLIDLQKIYDIDSMKIILYKNSDYQDVKVFISADSINWTEIVAERVSGWENIIPLVNKGFSYKWFKNDNLISTETNRILQAKTPGVYKLEISKNNCTSTSQSVTVKYDNPPTEDGEFDVFQDTIIACGKAVVLDIGLGYKSYFWNDSVRTQTRTIANSGKYNATVEYGTHGCKAKDSVFVDLFKSVLNQKDTTICLGSHLQLANKNKKLNPSIRYVKMAVTSSSSERLVWHIDVVSKGTNVSSNKWISSNRGSFIDELVRGDAYMGWYTPGSPSSVNDPSTFTLDLGKVYEFEDKINTLSLQLMSTLNYNIYVSTDNVNWIKIISENQASGSKTYNLDEIDILELTQNYQWYKNNTPIPSANFNSYDVKESGIYKLQATKGTCSLFSESVKIEVEKPDSNFTSFNPLKDSIVVCGNDSLELDGGPGFKLYNWNDSLFNAAQHLKVFKSGYFSVSVEYGTNGCKLSDFTNVKMYPNLKVNSQYTNSTSDSLLLCNGFGLALQDYYSNNFNTKVDWFNNGNYLNTGSGTFVMNTGKFHAELNMSGCKLVSNSKIIYTDNQFYLNILKDTVVCSSQNQLTFDPGKYDSYSWVIDKNTPISTRVLTVSNSSSVYYELNKHGCTRSGNFEVTYVKPIMNTKSINVCQSGFAHFFDVNVSNKINYTLFDIYNQVVYSPGGTTSSSQGNWYVTNPGSYFALANLGACSVKSDTVSVIVNKLPSAQLIYSRPLIVCNGNTLPIQISTTSGNKYNWSTGQNTNSISVVNAGSYSVNISDSNNCQVTASFTIAKAVLPSINLCMVTTENNKNKVIWNNAFPNYATLSTIRVYKQNSTTSQYDVIHKQGVNELSEFVDTTSEPSIKQARYKIALVDSCGNEKQSIYHNTILLTSNLGINNTVNLLWNKYEGFDYANFEIWRSEDGVYFTLLNSVSNTSTSFIDNNPPANCFYQVRITNPNECVSSKRGAYKTVSSNVVDKTGSTSMKIDENQSINITVYPNPSNGKFYIKSEYENSKAVIKDLNGKSVYKIVLINKTNEIDLSHILSEGVYLLELSNNTNNALYTTKLVVLD